MTSLNSKLNGDITSAYDSLLRLLNDCDVKDSPWCQVRHVHLLADLESRYLLLYSSKLI